MGKTARIRRTDNILEVVCIDINHGWTAMAVLSNPISRVLFAKVASWTHFNRQTDRGGINPRLLMAMAQAWILAFKKTYLLHLSHKYLWVFLSRLNSCYVLIICLCNKIWHYIYIYLSVYVHSISFHAFLEPIDLGIDKEITINSSQRVISNYNWMILKV